MANDSLGTALPYGGRRARLIQVLYRAANRSGLLRRYRDIEWGRVRRLVMVCKGNICRSPYADACARRLGIETLSCGLECTAGAPAHPSAIRNARRRHVDLLAHRTAPLTAVRLRSHDLILAMEPAQARRLAPVAQAAGAQLTLLGLWAGHPCIHDPYGLDDAAFQACYALIDESLTALRAMLTADAVADRRAD